MAASFVQGDKNFEVIIADDGPTANTQDCATPPRGVSLRAAEQP